MIHSDLKWEEVRVLQVIEAEGGEARTSEIREHVNFSEMVLNRVKSLVDEGLVELSGKVQEREGQRATNVYRVTEEGWDAIAQGLTERVRPTVTSRQIERIKSRVDQLEEEVEERDYEDLDETTHELVRDVDGLKREVQKRASEVQIDTLNEEIERLDDELDVLFGRVKDKASEEELEKVRATVENNEVYNKVLMELGTAAAMRDPDAEKYKQLRHLIALLVALERYLEATGVDIWAYHPSNAVEEA